MALHQALLVRDAIDEPASLQPGYTYQDDRDERIPPRAIVRLVAGGQIPNALKTSRRFLLKRLLKVDAKLVQDLHLSPEQARRHAAALLFPITDTTYRQLYDRIQPLNPEKESEQIHVQQ